MSDKLATEFLSYVQRLSDRLGPTIPESDRQVQSYFNKASDIWQLLNEEQRYNVSLRGDWFHFNKFARLENQRNPNKTITTRPRWHNGVASSLEFYITIEEH